MYDFLWNIRCPTTSRPLFYLYWAATSLSLSLRFLMKVANNKDAIQCTMVLSWKFLVISIVFSRNRGSILAIRPGQVGPTSGAFGFIMSDRPASISETGPMSSQLLEGFDKGGKTRPDLLTQSKSKSNWHKPTHGLENLEPHLNGSG